MNTTETTAQMQMQLTKMKQAQRAGGLPDTQTRIDRMQRCVDLLVDNKDAIAKALDEDYGGRSKYLTQMSEVMQCIGHFKFSIKNVKKWMKVEKRSAPFPMGLLGSRTEIRYQPKGVVGIMSPWNFPVAMIFNPLCYALAAGNRVVIKPSEFNPKTAELIKELIGKYFSDDEIYVVTGGPEVGAAFTSLPLDHILFTGATSIGKMIMSAAAENLTPVTLELGGKSPVIVDRDYDIALAAERLISGKCMNAGQVCVSPDYVFVPADKLEEFIQVAKDTFAAQFPSVHGNQDYTSVINDRHYDRLLGYLSKAKEAGVRIESLSNEAVEGDDRRIPVQLVVDPGDDQPIMQDEIFGPLMVLKSYTDFDDCINFINDRPAPLALYYFGDEKGKQAQVLDSTLSGGVTLNNVTMHVACYDIPFGGIGNSGMGSYHGIEGFKTFSHARGVFRQGKMDLAKMAGTLPPYSEKVDKMLESQIKK